MSYGQEPDIINHLVATNVEVVDLRSDTLTRPSDAMRRAMFEAEVGDDVYGEDPTVKKLEGKAAKLLGKEAALFVTSGTMGNLIAIMVHCDRRDSEAYCGKDCHVARHEQGGAAQIAGVTLCIMPNKSDGTYDLDQLESEIRFGNIHEPTSKLVLAENTINGKVVPQSWIDDLTKLSKKYGLKSHLDGARLLNASVASGLPAATIVADFDTVSFCISKGLGAPVGSLLCGSKAFVEKAKRVRKVLGGGMRQSGVLAAAGIVALDETVPLLQYDHARAKKFANSIIEAKFDMFSIDLKTTQTNIVFVKISSDRISAKDLIARLREVQDDVEEDKVIVRGMAMLSDMARFVFYRDINDHQTELAIKKVNYVMKILSTNTCKMRNGV